MAIILDNYDKFVEWVKSNGEWPATEMYHLQWLLRKKDGNCAKDSKASKHWFVRSFAELETVKPRLYEYAEKGGRITIGVNRKNVDACNFQLAHECMQASLKHVHPIATAIYPGVVDKVGASGRGFYMLDIDPMPEETREQLEARVERYCGFIESAMSNDKGKKVSAVFQSKSGFHIIFHRCSPDDVMSKITEPHDYATFFKDSTTNLIIGV